MSVQHYKSIQEGKKQQKKQKDFERFRSLSYQNQNAANSKKENVKASQRRNQFSFQEKMEQSNDENMFSNQLCSSHSFSQPFFGGSCDDILSKKELQKLLGFQESESIRFSSGQRFTFCKKNNSYPQKIVKKLLHLKQQFSILKTEMKAVSQISDKYQQTTEIIKKLSKVAQKTFNEHNDTLFQDKIRLVYQIKEKDSTITDLKSSNIILTQSLRQIEKNFQLQKSNTQQLKKKNEHQIIKLTTQLYRLKCENQSLESQNEQFKMKNEQLNEQLFDLSQKLKSFDLEVEKKFNLMVDEYHDNFMNKATKVKEKMELINNELSTKDFKNESTISRASTIKGFKQNFERKKSESFLNKKIKTVTIDSVKSDGEDSPIHLLPKSRATEDEKILRKQRSLMNFSKFNKNRINEDCTQKNFKERERIPFEKSVVLNPNEIEEKFGRFKERFAEDFQFMKKRKQF